MYNVIDRLEVDYTVFLLPDFNYGSFVQVAIGDKVWMAHIDHHEMEVGRGTVISLGGQGSFHNRPIPLEYVRINLEGVTVNVPLLVPVSEADQENLADAAGSSVLWLKQLTYHCK